MIAINCCKAMEIELAAWKATIYDIVRKMDRMPGGVKDQFLPNIEDLHILVEELDQRIEDIRANCTPETGIDDIKTMHPEVLSVAHRAADCRDWVEVKKKWGRKVCHYGYMDPVHTLYPGTPDQIRKECKKEIEESVTFVRLELYNREMPCGPKAVQERLRAFYHVKPLPYERSIVRILSRHGLTHGRTGLYQ